MVDSTFHSSEVSTRYMCESNQFPNIPLIALRQVNLTEETDQEFLSLKSLKFLGCVGNSFSFQANKIIYIRILDTEVQNFLSLKETPNSTQRS